jgi:uncharacterized protein
MLANHNYMKSKKRLQKLSSVIFILLSIVNYNFGFSQAYFCQFPKDSFKDSILLNEKIASVANKLLEVFKYNKYSSSTYYDNLFKCQFIAEKYRESLLSLEIVKKLIGQSDTNAAKGIGFQYKVYMESVMDQRDRKSSFVESFSAIFNKEYSTLPKSALPNATSYYNTKITEVRKTFNQILIKQSTLDSITYENAILLCRGYASYLVYSQSLEFGKQLLIKLESKDYIIRDSMIIKTRDGADISLTLVRKSEIKNKLPAIFVFSIYPSVSDLSDARTAADNGYVGVVANVRGKRLSKSEIEPFEHDANDVYDVIEWISKQDWCNGKVGMHGGSYLGFTQWAATKKPHSALKTIVPIASVAPAIDFGSENGIFESNALKFINNVTNNKYTDDNSFRSNWYMKSVRWYASGLAFNRFDSLESKTKPIFQKWLKHPTYDRYWQNMIPYKKDFSKINIPILSITGYFDGDQTGALYYFKEHYKYNKNANHYLVVGPYDHYGAQGTSSATIGNYKADSIANININELVYKWFDYILKDSIKPSILKDKVNYEVMGANRWEHKASIGKINNDTLQFYISNDALQTHKQLKNMQESKLSFSSETIDFKNRTDSLPKFWTNYIDTFLYKQNGTFYLSEPLKEVMSINGQFFGALNFSINKKDVDIFVNLYEQRPDGKYMYLSNIIFRASHAKDKTKRQLLKPNTIETVPINGGMFVSKQLQKGSRIVIALGVNKNPQYQINYGTGKDVSTESIKDAGEPLQIKWYNDSYIKIPVWRDKK